MGVLSLTLPGINLRPLNSYLYDILFQFKQYVYANFYLNSLSGLQVILPGINLTPENSIKFLFILYIFKNKKNAKNILILFRTPLKIIKVINIIKLEFKIITVSSFWQCILI